MNLPPRNTKGSGVVKQTVEPAAPKGVILSDAIQIPWPAVKVYLLYADRQVIAVCSSTLSAEKEKVKIEMTVQNLKTLYLSLYKSDYDKDIQILREGNFYFEPEYSKLTDRMYKFKIAHRELLISEFKIEEMELIN